MKVAKCQRFENFVVSVTFYFIDRGVLVTHQHLVRDERELCMIFAAANSNAHIGHIYILWLRQT